MPLIDRELLESFEAGLDPLHLERSRVPAKLLGYGEISAIFQINGDKSTVYKRMPLFSSREAAARYEALYHEYCALLARAGLSLPKTGTAITAAPGRPVCLYIAQERYPSERFGHQLLHALDKAGTESLIRDILLRTARVWEFNRKNRPGLEIAIDGQMSNWVLPEAGRGVVFLDTSTPLVRKNGAEQLDPELFLQATPGFLRWAARLFFLQDVMTRYYDPRKVAVDLAANLYKEQRPDLVPLALSAVNSILFSGQEPVTEQEVRRYYRFDKLIWASFLALRRLDRWITVQLWRKRYEFILPGRIKR